MDSPDTPQDCSPTPTQASMVVKSVKMVKIVEPVEPVKAIKAVKAAKKSQKLPPAPQKVPRPRKRVLGYIMEDEYIMEFAARHHVEVFDDWKPGNPINVTNTRHRAFDKILRDAQCGTYCLVKNPGGECRIAPCIAIAASASAEGLKKATPERIAKLRRTMEMDTDPQWHFVA